MTKREPRIVVIGAGIAGIATAVTLQRKGFHDFTILEKGADVGGVWHWNRYPGLTCDVPSQLYQFSFAPKPDWTGLFAPGDEIQRYLRDVVEHFGLEDHLRLNTEVVSAVFTESGWQVATSDGAELDADFVIAATGVLHHPFTPDIPGLVWNTGCNSWYLTDEGNVDLWPFDRKTMKAMRPARTVEVYCVRLGYFVACCTRGCACGAASSVRDSDRRRARWTVTQLTRSACTALGSAAGYPGRS